MKRQGDVLLVPVKKLPAGAKEATVNGDLILMHGEVTGHAHRIKEAPGKVKVWDSGAERLLQVMETVALTHEEHSAVVLEKGIYRQAFQVEERGEEVRRVAD